MNGVFDRVGQRVPGGETVRQIRNDDIISALIEIRRKDRRLDQLHRNLHFFILPAFLAAQIKPYIYIVRIVRIKSRAVLPFEKT